MLLTAYCLTSYLAEEVAVRVELEELHERVELAHAVLQRRAREAPAVCRREGEGRLRTQMQM